MKSQLIVLLGTAAMLAGCQFAVETPTKDSEGPSADMTQGNETGKSGALKRESMRTQEISQEEGLFLHSEVGGNTNRQATIVPRMGSDPAESALRYKEKADAVTQRMKDQSEETERYMQR